MFNLQTYQRKSLSSNVQGSEQMLAKIREGDRSVAAGFLLANKDLIRQRYRRKLGRLRRFLDSQELVSTLARRLDSFVLRRRVEAASEAQLFALIFRIGDNAIFDKARIFERLKRVEGADSGLAREWACRLARAERSRTDGAALEVARLMHFLTDPLDRRIVMLWLGGRDHADIASLLGVSHDCVRQRWSRLCVKLRVRGKETKA